MKRPAPMESASALMDQKIKQLGDRRGRTLAKVREIVHQADPEIVVVKRGKSGSGSSQLTYQVTQAPRFGPTAGSSARERRTRTSSR